MIFNALLQFTGMGQARATGERVLSSSSSTNTLETEEKVIRLFASIVHAAAVGFATRDKHKVVGAIIEKFISGDDAYQMVIKDVRQAVAPLITQNYGSIKVSVGTMQRLCQQVEGNSYLTPTEKRIQTKKNRIIRNVERIQKFGYQVLLSSIEKNLGVQERRIIKAKVFDKAIDAKKVLQKVDGVVVKALCAQERVTTKVRDEDKEVLQKFVEVFWREQFDLLGIGSDDIVGLIESVCADKVQKVLFSAMEAMTAEDEKQFQAAITKIQGSVPPLVSPKPVGRRSEAVNTSLPLDAPIIEKSKRLYRVRVRELFRIAPKVISFLIHLDKVLHLLSKKEITNRRIYRLVCKMLKINPQEESLKAKVFKYTYEKVYKDRRCRHLLHQVIRTGRRITAHEIRVARGMDRVDFANYLQRKVEWIVLEVMDRALSPLELALSENARNFPRSHG